MSGPTPDLLNQNLHFSKTPGDACAHKGVRSTATPPERHGFGMKLTWVLFCVPSFISSANWLSGFASLTVFFLTSETEGIGTANMV